MTLLVGLEVVGEIHGAEKPLDPNYKPEHQSKSKLPSVTGESSPVKTIRKPILQAPARLTPKRLATPESVRIQSDTTNDLPVTEPDPTPMKTPVMVHGGARPKTPRMEGTPLAPHTQPLTPRRILSSTPSGENGEEIDKRSELIRNIEERRRILEEKREILEEQNRKIFHSPPIEGIDVGVSTVWSWHSVLPYSMLCYNGYSSPNLNGYSQYELVFGHKMTLSTELEIKVDTVVSGTFKDYYEKLKKNLQYMGERLQKFKSQRPDLLNKDRKYQAFEVGQIVYMYQARGSVVETGSRKIRCNYIGPLVINVFRWINLPPFN